MNIQALRIQTDNKKIMRKRGKIDYDYRYFSFILVLVELIGHRRTFHGLHSSFQSLEQEENNICLKSITKEQELSQ